MSWAKARSHWLAILGLTKYAALKPLLVSFSPLEEMTLNANKTSKFSKFTNYASILS
jgi:hypothetical protein